MIVDARLSPVDASEQLCRDAERGRPFEETAHIRTGGYTL